MDKPEVDFPGGEPPTELQVTDVTVGERGRQSGRDRKANG